MPNTITKRMIEDRVQDVLAKANRRFRTKATISKVVYTDSSREVGKAVKEAGTGETYIKLSKHYINQTPEWILGEIIPHEIAHIICFWMADNGKPLGSYDHDENWERVAKALGSTGIAKPVVPDDFQRVPTRKIKYEYKTSTGNSIYLNRDAHYSIQKDFKTYRDNRDGGRITASGYVGKKKIRS